jgi:hypothetical protein
MPEKDPTNYPLITYAWVILLSSWGGIVSFMRKRREGLVRVFNITELLGELFTSAFVGIVTFMLCEWSGVAPLLTAAFVGITGHMGSRALFMFESWAESRFKAMAPGTEAKEDAP